MHFLSVFCSFKHFSSYSLLLFHCQLLCLFYGNVARLLIYLFIFVELFFFFFWKCWDCFYSSPKVAQGGPFRFGDGLNRSASGVKEVLLMWCQSRTREYKVRLASVSAQLSFHFTGFYFFSLPAMRANIRFFAPFNSIRS